MKRKNHFCLCLAFLLLMNFGLTACANNGSSSDQETSGSTAETAAAATETEIETETDVRDLLPEAVKYDGHTFNFVTVSHSWQQYDQMVFDELTGDGVVDAIFNRNITISDLLDISITEQLDYEDSIITKIGNSVASGDKSYDTAMCSVADASVMYNSNYITVLEDVIDFDAPWWYQQFNDYVNINGHDNEKFIAYGQGFVVSYVGGSMVIAANTDMIPRYNLEDPYTVYQEGRWTMDHMYENSQAVAADLNGNGTVTDYTVDQIGSVGANNQFSLLLAAAGEPLAVREGDTYVLKVSERFYDVYNKVIQLVTNDAACWRGVSGRDSEYYWTIFNEGRSLYMSNAIAAFKSARDGEIPYVLLPYPKADESQNDYYNVISNFVCGMVIPNGQNEEELARTAMILEYLSAYSEPIYDAFVESTLYHKYARDAESIVVFRSMLDNIPYNDLGFLFDWGGIRTNIDSAVAAKTPLASRLKMLEKLFNKAASNSMKS